MQCEFNPVVRHPPLREIVGTDFFGTVSRTDLASSGLRLGIMLFSSSISYRRALQHFECLFLYFEL